MPLPNNVLVAHLVIKTLRDDRKNTFYYEVGPGSINSSNAIVACCNAIFTHLATPIAGILSPEIKVTQCIAKYISNGNEWEGVSNAGVVPGSHTVTSLDQDAMPDDVVAMFKVMTGKHGRDKRGRRFISGVSEEVFENGVVKTAAQAAMIAVATAIPETVTANFNGEPITLSARHYSRKTSTVLPISKVYAMNIAMSRMDRRQPLDVLPVPIDVGGG